MDESFERRNDSVEQRRAEVVGGDSSGDQPQRRNRKVLVIEGDAAIGELLKTILEDEAGCETEWVRNIPEDTNSPWYEVLLQRPQQPDLVLVDLSVVYPQNTLLLEELAERGINLPPLVIMSDSPADYAQQEAARVNAAGLVVKPFEIDTLLGAVNSILKPQPRE